MPDGARLAAAARGMLPGGVAVAHADPGQLYPLLAGETLPGAVPHRLREFSAGRHAARAALAALGRPLTALPAGDDRAPLWPDGVAGSITHSRTACLAAASTRLSGLGLDLEEETPLDRALWPEVLLESERMWVLRQPDPGLMAKLVFSAKEAAYKAQFAMSRTLFGFDTLGIVLGDGVFSATFRKPVAPFAAGYVIDGRFALTEGHILTVASL